MVVRELLTRLSFSVNESQLKKYEQGTRNIQSAAENAANSFRNMFAAFLGFQSVKSIISIADEMQNLRARLALLPQTSMDAGQALDVVADRAINARQSIEAYAGFYVKAGEATKKFISTQDDLLKIVDGAAFGLAASGADAVRQGQAFFQLGQAISSPTVQMEEMNTLIDAAPQLFAALGDAIVGEGKNFKEIIGKGKITGQMLAEGLSKVAPYFEARMKTIPNTVEQATLRIRNKWKLFVDRLNRDSMVITRVANFIGDSFDYVEEKLNIFVEKIGGANQALKLFGIVAAAALTPLLIKGFAGAIMFILSPIGLLVAGLTLLYIALEDIYTWMQGGESIIGEWLGSFNEFSDKFDSTFVGKIINGLKKLWQFLSITIDWGAIFNAGADVLGSLFDVLSGIFNFVVGIAKTFFGLLSGDFDLFYEGIKQAFDGLFEAFKGAFGAIGSFIGLIIESVKNAFNVAITAISVFLVDSIYGGIKDAISRGLNFFGVGQPNTSVTPQQAANATISAGGAGSRTNTNNVTINQNLPAGSPPEVQAAARAGTQQALSDGKLDVLARQMGAMS